MRPIVALLVLAALVACTLLQDAYLILPRALQNLAEALAWLRLGSDPAHGVFWPWQLWTHVLFHADGLHLLTAGVSWAVMATALERHAGHRVILLLLLACAPIAPLLILLAGHGGAEPGILAPALAAGATAAAIGVPGMRIIMGIIAAAELGRLVGVAFSVRPDSPGGLFAGPAALAVAWSLGHSIGRVLRPLPVGPGTILLALAEGRLELDRLEEVLARETELPLDLLDRVARRCIAEDRMDAGRVLATYLALRDPGCTAYERLRRWLGRHDAAQPR